MNAASGTYVCGAPAHLFHELNSVASAAWCVQNADPDAQCRSNASLIAIACALNWAGCTVQERGDAGL